MLTQLKQLQEEKRTELWIAGTSDIRSNLAPVYALCLPYLTATCFSFPNSIFKVRSQVSFAVRIGLNGRVAPRTRDGIFAGAVLTALLHAGYVMSGDSSMGAGN